MSNPYWIGDIEIDAERLPNMREGQLIPLSVLARVERIVTEKIGATEFGDTEPRELDGATSVLLSIRTLYRDGVTTGAERLASI